MWNANIILGNEHLVLQCTGLACCGDYNIGRRCRVLHTVHHKYNKEHSMSPFAGLAFHPFDGILQVGITCLWAAISSE